MVPVLAPSGWVCCCSGCGMAVPGRRRHDCVRGLKARNVIAWAEGPGTRHPKTCQACKAGTTTPIQKSNSIPRVTFVQPFAILLANPPKLRLKILPRVMRRLITNIVPHRFDVHWADSKLAIAALPREIRIRRVKSLDPSRRGGFHLLNDLCRRVVLRLPKQNMDVVTNGIDLNQR